LYRKNPFVVRFSNHEWIFAQLRVTVEGVCRYVYIALIVLLTAVVLIFKFKNLNSVTISLLRMSATLPLSTLVILVYLLGMVTGALCLAWSGAGCAAPRSRHVERSPAIVRRRQSLTAHRRQSYKSVEDASKQLRIYRQPSEVARPGIQTLPPLSALRKEPRILKSGIMESSSGRFEHELRETGVVFAKAA
jgi:lipopolysaccharide assembly protein A